MYFLLNITFISLQTIAERNFRKWPKQFFFSVHIRIIKTKFEAFPKDFLEEDNNGKDSIEIQCSLRSFSMQC